MYLSAASWGALHCCFLSEAVMASEDSGLEGNVDVIRCSRSSCCILHESCKRSYEADLRAGRRERHLHFGSSRLRVAAVGRVTTGSSSSSPTQPPLSVPPEPLRPTLPVAASRSGPASACVCPPSHTLGPRRLLLVGRPPLLRLSRAQQVMSSGAAAPDPNRRRKIRVTGASLPWCRSRATPSPRGVRDRGGTRR